MRHRATLTALSAAGLVALLGGLAKAQQPAAPPVRRPLPPRTPTGRVPTAPPALPGDPGGTGQARRVSFSKDVMPIFKRSCQSCHGLQEQGGLTLDTYQNTLLGGAKGDILVKGFPDRSRLIHYVEGILQPRMPPPPQRPLTRAEISTLRNWIQQGAEDDTETIAPMGSIRPLTVQEPKDGATVRERVKIVVPRASIPAEGFVSVTIDGQFKAALAPPSEEEITERKLKGDAPVVYYWDTQEPLAQDLTLAQTQRLVQDGPHTIEIRSYDQRGGLVETAPVQVNVRNQLDVAKNTPVRLAYGGRLGAQYDLEHVVDLEASGVQAGSRRGGSAAPVAAGPDKMLHRETTTYLVSMEDQMGGGTAFWRERRESPITVVVNNVKHVVRFDSSSRYYSMDRRGNAVREKRMEQEGRVPILNPLDLPGGPHRLGVPFSTNLRVHLGAYMSDALNVNRVQATPEGMEWQGGEKCVRVRMNYLAGKGKVDLTSLGISQADFEIQRGESTIWFSEQTQRVVEAKHEITAAMVVDVAQLGGAGAGSGGGGEFAPGGVAMPSFGGGGNGPSMGRPGGGGNSAGGGFGSPFGGGGGGNSAGGGGGRPFGGGGGNSAGGGGGNSAGRGFGSPFGGGGNGPGGGMGGAVPQYGGGSPAVMAGPPPTTKRYHCTLKITTRVVK